MTKRTVAFTFAGRKAVMSNLIQDMKVMLSQGTISEWHVWNFSRNDSDNHWLNETFSEHPVLFTTSDSVEYLPFLRDLSDDIAILFQGSNDAHLMINGSSGLSVGKNGASIKRRRLFS
jgi:hypothetical protein